MNKFPDSSQRENFLQWLNRQICLLAAQLGIQPAPERVVLYVEALSNIPQTKLEPVFQRLRYEAQTFPQVATIREMALGSQEGEALAAWERAVQFAIKYVDCDVFGNYGPEHGWHPKDHPPLNDRILQTVRMTGGWRAIKLMDDGDEPFVRKRFLEAYEYAPEALAFPVGFFEKMPAVKQLAEVKEMPRSSKPPAPVPRLEQIAKPMPAAKPLNDAELRERREMLRQQAEKIIALRKAAGGDEQPK